jgi:hypothetical protein
VPETTRLESTALVALKRRLTAGELTDEDRASLERCARLRALRAEGKSFDECAREMSEKAVTLSKFARSDTFAALSEFIEAARDALDAKAMERAVRRGRLTMAGLVPEACRYIRDAFRRHPPGTTIKRGGIEIDLSDEPIDDGKAMWATELIAKNTGMLEPITTKAPTLVNPTFINNTIVMSRGDDAQAAKAAAVETIDITPGTAE